jgi:hypothetical protein
MKQTLFCRRLSVSLKPSLLSFRICLTTLAVVLVVSLVALAQETTGGIQGTVKDPQGAVVRDATVEVTSTSLIGTKTAVTDSSGTYHFEQLPPGVYTIAVHAHGFAPQIQNNLQLETGALPNVNFTLRVGETSSTIEVSSESQLVDVTQSKVQTDVNQELLTELPKGRSFQSLIPFAPGARQEPLQGTTANRTNGYQIDGASDGENTYLIDGINTTNVQNGGVGKNFQDDFVQEVQIKSSSFEAEYGGAIGGVINAIPKRGSNRWHGEVKAYFQFSGLNANDPCASGFTSAGQNPPGAQGSTVCGLRLNPTLPQLNTTNRQDGTPQYFIPKKDRRSIIEPGYELGGPLLTDRLWLFSSYVPTLDVIHRTSTFLGSFSNFLPDSRELTQTYTQHNMYNRLDFRAFDKLRLFGSWNYAYARVTGTLGAPDSAIGQLNVCGGGVLCNGTGTDPSSLRADGGAAYPLSLFTFGGDWTPTSKLVVSARYGYFFSNTGTRGTPTGVRYLYDNALSPGTTLNPTKDLVGNVIPSNAPFNNSGFSNIPSTYATFFDAYQRRNFNVDVSYYVGNLWGSHTFKTGYFWSTQYNNVLRTTNGPWVNIDWLTDYSPVTSTSACDAIKAGNTGNAAGKCEGVYGFFFTGSNTTSNTGKVTATDQAYYLEDAWTVGKTGLTLNLGVRFDHETNPPYNSNRFPSVNFGWGDKIAPRLGAAYDVLHNGKLKVYASYGKFFDIMKLGLTRGSFGSDYWHECVYALDTFNFNTIVPTLQTQGGCPPTGQAPGVSGRFIENVDFRATKADPRDPAVQAGMKPLQNHEFVAGVDWAITSKLGLETRFVRKRIDNAIEDMSITDNLGFYVGNPGSQFADLLHRPTVIPDASGNNYLNTVPFCAECPPVVRAIRRYDGMEVRLTRNSVNWYGSLSYTYSKLTGNYPGLTNTDPTDGGGGRHSPNNSRLFDLPTMTYLPNGKIDDGPLSTDRPNTAKVFGFYRLPWFGHSTSFGVSQALFEGTPISTCLPVVGTSSACQWAEGRGNRALLSRDPVNGGTPTSPGGNVVLNGVQHDWRTPSYFQTDFTLRQEVKISQTHENFRLVVEGNVYNLFNQHSAVGFYEFAIPTGLISPSRPSRFSGDPGVDWGKVMNGYNYIDALNATGAFAGVQAKRTLASRYGLPQVFQTARQFRIAARFVF